MKDLASLGNLESLQDLLSFQCEFKKTVANEAVKKVLKVEFIEYSNKFNDVKFVLIKLLLEVNKTYQVMETWQVRIFDKLRNFCIHCSFNKSEILTNFL